MPWGIRKTNLGQNQFQVETKRLSALPRAATATSVTVTLNSHLILMAIIEGDEISQLWGLITELSEQLNQNRSTSVSLYAQAASVKVGVELYTPVSPHIFPF